MSEMSRDETNILSEDGRSWVVPTNVIDNADWHLPSVSRALRTEIFLSQAF
jgi:hypothetical protein